LTDPTVFRGGNQQSLLDPARSGHNRRGVTLYLKLGDCEGSGGGSPPPAMSRLERRILGVRGPHKLKDFKRCHFTIWYYGMQFQTPAFSYFCKFWGWNTIATPTHRRRNERKSGTAQIHGERGNASLYRGSGGRAPSRVQGQSPWSGG